MRNIFLFGNLHFVLERQAIADARFDHVVDNMRLQHACSVNSGFAHSVKVSPRDAVSHYM